MPRHCTICTSPQRQDIDKALITPGLSLRDVASRFGLTKSSVTRHKREHLARALARVESERNETVAQYAYRHEAANRQHAIDVMSELVRQIDRFNKLSDAVHDWLTDPNDPERYDISPRADEVDVIYLDATDLSESGQPKRKRGKLSELVRRLEGERVYMDKMSFRQADRRELLLKAGDGLKNQLGLWVQIVDKLRDVSEIERFKGAVLDAVAEASPEVRDAIQESLRRRGPMLPS